MEFINPTIAAYADQMTSSPPDDVLRIVQQTDAELEHSDMISGPTVVQLLQLLVRISGARRVLEIGTFTGYSALSMAHALPPDGALITCEMNERYEPIARTAFEKSAHGHKISLKMGPAMQTIEKLSPHFDFVFLDADKAGYPGYFEAIQPLLANDGLLVADNVLWNGKAVAEPRDRKAQAVHQFNQEVANHPDFEQVLLTVRDGLTIARKIDG